jgi:hypothetical protein
MSSIHAAVRSALNDAALGIPVSDSLLPLLPPEEVWGKEVVSLPYCREVVVSLRILVQVSLSQAKQGEAFPSCLVSLVACFFRSSLLSPPLYDSMEEEQEALKGYVSTLLSLPSLPLDVAEKGKEAEQAILSFCERSDAREEWKERKRLREVREAAGKKKRPDDCFAEDLEKEVICLKRSGAGTRDERETLLGCFDAMLEFGFPSNPVWGKRPLVEGAKSKVQGVNEFLSLVYQGLSCSLLGSPEDDSFFHPAIGKHVLEVASFDLNLLPEWASGIARDAFSHLSPSVTQVKFFLSSPTPYREGTDSLFHGSACLSTARAEMGEELLQMMEMADRAASGSAEMTGRMQSLLSSPLKVRVNKRGGEGQMITLCGKVKKQVGLEKRRSKDFIGEPRLHFLPFLLDLFFPPSGEALEERFPRFSCVRFSEGAEMEVCSVTDKDGKVVEGEGGKPKKRMKLVHPDGVERETCVTEKMLNTDADLAKKYEEVHTLIYTLRSRMRKMASLLKSEFRLEMAVGTGDEVFAVDPSKVGDKVKEAVGILHMLNLKRAADEEREAKNNGSDGQGGEGEEERASKRKRGDSDDGEGEGEEKGGKRKRGDSEVEEGEEEEKGSKGKREDSSEEEGEEEEEEEEEEGSDGSEYVEEEEGDASSEGEESEEEEEYEDEGSDEEDEGSDEEDEGSDEEDEGSDEEDEDE